MSSADSCAATMGLLCYVPRANAPTHAEAAHAIVALHNLQQSGAPYQCAVITCASFVRIRTCAAHCKSVCERALSVQCKIVQESAALTGFEHNSVSPFGTEHK